MEQQTVIDIKLWSAATCGDRTAFSELFVAYFPKLFRFALNYTKDSCIAEDAVQQVFLKCWEKKEDLGYVVHIGPYLYRCTKNEVMDVLRRQALYLKYQIEVTSTQSVADLETEPADAYKVLQGKEEILTAAVDHLSPQQKKVYKLSKEQGWSYGKIAKEMQVSPHTVKWHAAAAFQSLRHFLISHEKELFSFFLLISCFF